MQRPQTGLFIGIIGENNTQSIRNGIMRWTSYGERMQEELDGLNKFYAEWRANKGYEPSALDERIAKLESILDKVNQEITYLNWLLNELEPQPEPEPESTKPITEVEESDNFGM